LADECIIRIRVAVVLPVRETFSYAVPENIRQRPLVGCRVRVPFGRRKAAGYVLEEESSHDGRPVRSILELLDDEPWFHGNAVPFFEWLASYYLHPIGPLIQSVLPGGGRGLVSRSARLTDRGQAILVRLPVRSAERELLCWVRDHPGKRLPFPARDVRDMERRGLLIVESRRPGRPAGGSRKQRFVRPCEGAVLEDILDKRSSTQPTRNEPEFLSRVFRSEGVRLREFKRRYDNGEYLVRKWIAKGVIETYDDFVYQGPSGEPLFPSPEPEMLLPQQSEVLEKIRELLERRAFATCLLHGVTGSGKTEIYYRAALEAIESGRQVLVLVPEISLAVVMEGLFRSRLGDRVALYHSDLSQGERYDQWLRTARGEVDVVIGARSALFAPLSRPGLIVVDEEHDTSYKQEEAPRYQARDAAVVRGKMVDAVVVLGSGTPSIQSFHNAVKGKYRLLSMPHRVEKRPLPEVEIVDMKEVSGRSGLDGIISPALRQALEDSLARGNQSLLFLNRRGFHRVFLCTHCGESVRCPNCDLALIHHFREDRLACHYCGYSTKPARRCAACGSREMRALGFGTERLETELSRLLPGARIGRMDRDSTRRKGASRRLLERFGGGEIDVLVGTQMITKGYDFPNVTLVGVIAADASLGFPDFRAAERTFQLLCQVAGRAGRGDKPGRVLVQTFNPGHYAVAAARAHDYPSFFRQETELRRLLGYPPFAYLACIRIQGRRQDVAERAARRLGRGMEEVRRGMRREGSGLRVLGPVEAPIARIQGKYRWQILVKSPGVDTLHRFLLQVEERSDRLVRNAGVRVVTDVDPYQML